MKQWLKTSLMALVLVLLGFTFPRDSLAVGTLVLPDVSAPQGNTVSMTATLSSTDICSGSFSLSYDAGELELTEAVLPESNWTGAINASQAGTIRISFASTTPLDQDEALCHLTFRITGKTPASGTDVAFEDVRLYDRDGIPVECASQDGSVSRSDKVSLTLSSTEAILQQQAVPVDVILSGDSCPAGGSFHIEYDPLLLEPVSVLPQAGLEGAQLSYNLDTAGIVKISFASVTPRPAGKLCSVVFRVIADAADSTPLSFSQVSMHDENGDHMICTATGGSLEIKAPSENRSELWVTGSSIGTDGTATAAILLDGKELVCGGELTLTYDPAMTVSVSPGYNCSYKVTQAGTLRLSWAGADPYESNATLASLTFTNAVEGPLLLTDVVLYDSEGSALWDMEVRSGSIDSNVYYDAASGTITLPELPESVFAVFASLYTEDQQLSYGFGTETITLKKEDLQSANYIKVFYLDDQYRPIAKPGYIPI